MIPGFGGASESAVRARLLGSLMTICLLAAPSAAKAGDVDLTFTTPENTANTEVRVFIGIKTIPVVIMPKMSAEEKRDAILAAIKGNAAPKYTVDPVKTTGLVIKDLTKGTKVSFYAGATGEKVDKATASLAPSADIDFNNARFATLDYSGNAATFTGGVVTSVGTFSDTITASISNPYISGATIANALYTYLAPLQSLDDFTVVKAGKYDQDLDFTFSNPKFAFTGVEFGTTSKSRGVAGGVVAGVPAPAPSNVALVALFGLYLAARRVWRDDRKLNV